MMQIDDIGMDGNKTEIACGADGRTGKDAVEFDHVRLEHGLFSKRIAGSVSAIAVWGNIA